MKSARGAGDGGGALSWVSLRRLLRCRCVRFCTVRGTETGYNQIRELITRRVFYAFCRGRRQRHLHMKLIILSAAIKLTPDRWNVLIYMRLIDMYQHRCIASTPGTGRSTSWSWINDISTDVGRCANGGLATDSLDRWPPLGQHSRSHTFWIIELIRNRAHHGRKSARANFADWRR